MSETKEQIRTELINELIEKLPKIQPILSTYGEGYNDCIKDVAENLKSLIPPETPEKIAKEKALNLICDNYDLTADLDRKYVMEVIEALLTDITK